MDYPKLFESITKQSLIAEGACVDRLPDQMTGNLGSTNPGDFTAYKYPAFCYVECKSCTQASFDIKQHIPEGQWLELLKKAKGHFPGVYVGYVIWFVTEHRIFWIDAPGMEVLYKEHTRSFTVADLDTKYKKFVINLDTEPSGKHFLIKNLFNSITKSSYYIEEAKQAVIDLVNASLDPEDNLCVTAADIQYLGATVYEEVCYYLFKVQEFVTSYWAVSHIKFNCIRFDAKEQF